ncbi:CAP domain-containing protein [Pseudoruminococcus massiliensis]|uniref:CAP domain-containing protein n=1 Tax=Pseudoruminococcus massiliensis TaxID=2086583 RepID=UPI000D0EED94|nr:CAP domain-containing protein [Pseudoruminococcus massiliensis]
MKKKIIFSSILLATVIALVIAMVLAVSACSSSETAPTNAQIENSSENTVNNTSLESSFDNSSESKISEKSNIESSINSNVSSDSQNSKVENSKKETQNSNSSSKPTETSKSSNTSTNSSSNSKVPSNDSSSKPSSGGSSSGSSSSSSSTPSHSHSYSSKTIKATCTSGGYTVHTCSCGASYTDSYTDATGHRWSDWKTVKKATTSSEGRKQRTCNSCGKTESKTIAKVQGSSTSGGHRITGARKAVYSYRGMDSFSSVNLVDLINAERAKEGLGKLEWTADGLTRLINEDPSAKNDFDYLFDSTGKFDPYRDPEVREPLEGAQKMANMGYATHGSGVGCSCVGASEGASTIEEALRRQIKAYMNSPEHRAILMNAGSHSVTAAYAIDSNGTVYTAIRVGGAIV